MSHKSWKYQKGRYKQVNIKFNMEDDLDMLVYHYIVNVQNSSEFIKGLVKSKMWEDAYNEK